MAGRDVARVATEVADIHDSWDGDERWLRQSFVDKDWVKRFEFHTNSNKGKSSGDG